MSDAVMLAIIALVGTIVTGIISLASAVFLAYIAWRTRQTELLIAEANLGAAKGREDAAKEAKEVKTTLVETQSKLVDAQVKIDASQLAQQEHIGEILELSDKTHKLVNSAMGTQLRLHAATARAHANSLPGDIAAEEVALLAERALKEHEAGQALVDYTTYKKMPPGDRGEKAGT